MGPADGQDVQVTVPIHVDELGPYVMFKAPVNLDSVPRLAVATILVDDDPPDVGVACVVFPDHKVNVPILI